MVGWLKLVNVRVTSVKTDGGGAGTAEIVARSGSHGRKEAGTTKIRPRDVNGSRQRGLSGDSENMQKTAKQKNNETVERSGVE